MSRDKFSVEIDKILNKLIELENNREKFNKIIRKLKKTINLEVLPKNLTNYLWGKQLYELITPANLNGLKIAGIDGSIISKSLFGIDLIITRAVGVIFSFIGKKPNVKYYPENDNFPEIKTSFDPFTNIESEIFSNLERINIEIDTTIKILNEDPDIVLLDGPILPQLREREGLKSSLNNKYNIIVKKYEKLFEECIDKNIYLVGCIKDTRSSHFLKIFAQLMPILINKYPELREILDTNYDYRRLLLNNRDCDFLYRFLDVNERSLIFDYHDFDNKLPKVFSIFNQYWVEKIKIFYLKPVEYDLPFRVEVLIPENDSEKIIKICNQIASILIPLSNHHPEFAVPSILIEADAKARLSNLDLEIIYESLKYKLGRNSPLLFDLRRNRRPF